MSTDPKQILILGGGFAGVYTARCPEKLLRFEEASITLINRENYWVYQPMLPEVISGSIGLTNIVSPIRRLCPRTNLIMREVEDIDLKRQLVTISPGFRPRQLQLAYDHLVIALGNITNFHGMPGLIENAMPFRTLADAMVLRNHVIHVLEEADVEDDPELRRQLLTFVVGGGGFSGVEVMAELNDFMHSVKRNYLRLRNEPHRCVIVQAGDRILPEMSETLAIFAQRILRKRGVEIILNDRLKAATSERAILQSGTEIPCKTLVSTVPSALPPVVQKLDCRKEQGKLLVNTGLELEDYAGTVWALGDCATIKTVTGAKVPPTAQHAVRDAVAAATNIAAAVRGGKRVEFGFEGLGTLGSLGHRAAVAQIFGVKVSGFLAWCLWRGIYLVKMPGLNRKVRIVTDWILHLLFPPELAQTKVAFESGIRNQHFEPGDVTLSRATSVTASMSSRRVSATCSANTKANTNTWRRWVAALISGDGVAFRSDSQRHDPRPHRYECLDHSEAGFQQAAPERAGFWKRLHRARQAARAGKVTAFGRGTRYGRGPNRDPDSEEGARASTQFCAHLGWLS